MIIVTRSVSLSNTLYSVLLEAEGKFLSLGQEWIGSLVRYEQKSICFSKIFADDPFYTSPDGIKNDECEYFGHAIINDDRVYFQNFVFDVLFEIKYHFGRVMILIIKFFNYLKSI